ncbi:MAG: ATP-binding cassette domain-containing protein [Methylotenera sp.]|nr:ATP-binding cassette domain-containing protein [Oligoflexia bacterium]
MTIRFDHVTKSFGPKTILNDVSFEVAEGEILFVLGKSGMGKSVTLKHIVGVMKPSTGKVYIGSTDVTQLDDEGLARIRRKCGMVFQQPALLDSLTIYENVSFGLRTPGYVRSLERPLTEMEIREKVIAKLRLVHLGTEILDRKPPEISYGMQKRVSLARTLAPSPEILLFDEPTTGLDPISTRAVNQLILELSRQLKVTSVVVSHDMACALEIADRILVLDQARILALNTVPEIKRSKIPLIQEFLEETLQDPGTGGAR